MYCFTHVNNVCCIINELLLWSEISSEHPTFIKTVAELTKKNLSSRLINELNEINAEFTMLNKKAKALRGRNMAAPHMYYNHMMEIKSLIDEFLTHDRHFLSVLPTIRQIGKEDKVWQELLEHIAYEQTFMYETFTNIKMQIIA